MQPRCVYITRDILEKFGFNDESKKCKTLQRGFEGRGVPHSQSCRQIIEAKMRADEQYKLRVDAADERRAKYLAEELERAVEGEERREVHGPPLADLPHPVDEQRVPAGPAPLAHRAPVEHSRGEQGHGGGDGDDPMRVRGPEAHEAALPVPVQEEGADDDMGIPKVPGSTEAGGDDEMEPEDDQEAKRRRVGLLSLAGVIHNSEDAYSRQIDDLECLMNVTREEPMNKLPHGVRLWWSRVGH